MSQTTKLIIKCYSCLKAMIDVQGIPMFCRKLRKELPNGYTMLNLSRNCGEKPKKILNLGCNEDNFGTHRVDLVLTGTTTHVFNIEEGIKFEDEFFDIIYERNLFEHLKNHGFHLEECYRVLKQGGKIVLITDNASCIRHYLSGTHGGRYEKKSVNPLDKHYAIFTKNHLKNLVSEVGFLIEKIKYVETNYWTKWLDRMSRPFLLFSGFSYPRILVVAKK